MVFYATGLRPVCTGGLTVLKDVSTFWATHGVGTVGAVAVKLLLIIGCCWCQALAHTAAVAVGCRWHVGGYRLLHFWLVFGTN